MEEKINLLEALLDGAEKYAKTSIELFKLKALNTASEVISITIARIIAASILFFFLVFVSIGIAIWLGHLIDSAWGGFLIVAAFYGVTGIVSFMFLHKWLKKIFSDIFIKLMFK